MIHIQLNLNMPKEITEQVEAYAAKHESTATTVRQLIGVYNRAFEYIIGLQTAATKVSGHRNSTMLEKYDSVEGMVRRSSGWAYANIRDVQSSWMSGLAKLNSNTMPPADSFEGKVLALVESGVLKVGKKPKEAKEGDLTPALADALGIGYHQHSDAILLKEQFTEALSIYDSITAYFTELEKFNIDRSAIVAEVNAEEQIKAETTAAQYTPEDILGACSSGGV